MEVFLFHKPYIPPGITTDFQTGENISSGENGFSGMLTVWHHSLLDSLMDFSSTRPQIPMNLLIHS